MTTQNRVIGLQIDSLTYEDCEALSMLLAHGPDEEDEEDLFDALCRMPTGARNGSIARGRCESS